jgi:hypothetical protein
MILEHSMSDWGCVHVGFQGDGPTIGGLDVWKETWRALDSDFVELPHPAHPNQVHRYWIYEIGDTAKPVRFAAGELSNGVWGFYVPT